MKTQCSKNKNLNTYCFHNFKKWFTWYFKMNVTDSNDNKPHLRDILQFTLSYNSMIYYFFLNEKFIYFLKCLF